MKMSRDNIKINYQKLERMMKNILRLEKKNNKTKTKLDRDMVSEIKKIIIDELKENE